MSPAGVLAHRLMWRPRRWPGSARSRLKVMGDFGVVVGPRWESVEQEHHGPLPAPAEGDAMSPAADQGLALVDPFPRPGSLLGLTAETAGHRCTAGRAPGPGLGSVSRAATGTSSWLQRSTRSTGCPHSR